MTGRLPPQIRQALKRSPLGQLLRRRHIFAVGLPKSGTESIARIFSRRFRSAHEPRYAETIALASALDKGLLSDDAIRAALRDRDRSLRLDCEASHLLARFAPYLVEVFPRARFILTIREPLSWLDSEINQCINYPSTNPAPGFAPWIESRVLNYGPIPEQRPAEEDAFGRWGLHSLDGMLGYWARHIRQVVESVPAARLLVIKVEDLSRALPEIAAFVDVPAGDLETDAAHSHKAPSRHAVLTELPVTYLCQRARLHCEAIATRYYGQWAPERFVKSLRRPQP